MYQGVKIDYKDSNVNPENFLAVLEGNAEAVKGKGTGRVLNSTSSDNVFVFFSDHGSHGLVAFPHEELYADDLVETLKKMRTNNRFKELVFYLEACESGSMFDKILPKDIGVYATTASDPYKSSWATYCYPYDKINGKSIGSCLGDEYSVNWMEHADADNGLKSTLKQQFQHVKKATKKSPVLQYGDLTFVDKDVGQYLGSHVEETKVESKDNENEQYFQLARESGVDSRYATLFYFKHLADQNGPHSYEAQEYLKELEHINITDKIFKSFNENFNINKHFEIEYTNFACLKNSVEAYKKICQNWGEYDLKYVKNISYACQYNSAEEISGAFKLICS